jgi:Sec-independent protein translocase protein TatA
MQIFGSIGTSEILLVLILMIILLGPQKMVEGAKDLGKTIRKVTRSQFWKDVKQTSREIRDIPKKIMEEADIEDDVKEIKNVLEGNFDQSILERTHAPQINPPSSHPDHTTEDEEKKS